MFQLVELGMLVGGAWALITGKIPTILFGGPQYEVKGATARLISLLVMVPLPAVYLVAFVGTQLGSGEIRQFLPEIEIAILVVVGITSVIWVRSARTLIMKKDASGAEVPAVSPIEKEIADKVNGSLIYLILGGIGIAGVILCPAVYWRTTQAMNLIFKHNEGHQYLGRAQSMRLISIVLSGLWLIATCYAVWFVVSVLSRAQ